jgi:hypothetical protein
MSEPTIVALPPLDNTSDDGYNDAASNQSEDRDDDNDNDDTYQIRGDRLREGKCPECGQQLYVSVRKGVLRKRILKPLTIEGLVVRGQCVKCIVTAGDEDLAVALAAMPEVALAATVPDESSNIEGFADATVPPPTATYVPTNPGMAQAYDTTYKGEYNDYGERHGEGELTWSNGDKYVGHFWHGVREGEGTLHFKDGASFFNFFNSSTVILVLVLVLTTSSPITANNPGSEYVGNWENNKMHGQGTRRFPNGNIFTGIYKEGKRSGQGRCYFANGDMYVGEWKGDAMSGFGRYYYNNGQSFEGFFLDGKRNGKGKYQLTDGRVDIYRYVNDVRAGDGVRWSANRKRTWRLKDGKVKGKISLQVATQIMAQCQQGQPELPAAVAETVDLS